MIEADKLVKDFYDIRALDQVSFNVRKGSIYGLLGSNGAGKTTLLKILAGIYREDEGWVRIGGEKVFENPVIKGKISFIPDALYFFPNYTIEDMARFYSSVYLSWNEERYMGLGEVFKIEPKRKIRTLSKGMQRQVAFWLNFSLMPEVMILDEPLDGLDPVMRKKVKNLIVKDVAERETTVVISSHNLRELEDLCDYIGILHEGKMLVQKDLDEYKANMHKVQIAFSREVPEAIWKDEKINCVERRGSVLVFIAKGKRDEVINHFNSYEPAILDVLPLTLEEVFVYEMEGEGYEIRSIFD
ncbi:ABC transporter ATP-binding protein [Thermosyntropha sp.]|uniref:ABC transporter ATP-binding protein n=1 Tax=Thermosyntropha sp. TaxID=2740820 RepID=UPI0025CD91EC|nr:ABC transporter ATP-binding protein [Thermosyntropha sp.]MBO8158740.1 ABC transporter ATP-binding protein [Thermosyntropha sp.]